MIDKLLTSVYTLPFLRIEPSFDNTRGPRRFRQHYGGPGFACLILGHTVIDEVEMSRLAELELQAEKIWTELSRTGLNATGTKITANLKEPPTLLWPR